ncbi:hypothetical protein RB195_013988 [Necator americanus]|uniref:Uncharacterized protein n=1 Tax=Necator americanus TaxID=51031 RepID=A0ABR1DYH0_NECAM
MNSSNQKQTDSYEETQSDSSIWASEREWHPFDSGDEGDIDSYSATASLRSEDFEICSPVVVDQSPVTGEEPDRIVYINARKQSCRKTVEWAKSVRRVHATRERTTKTSSESTSSCKSQSDNTKVCQSTNQELIINFVIFMGPD